jgi:uncharacterized protein (TIGR03437 family)
LNANKPLRKTTNLLPWLSALALLAAADSSRKPAPPSIRPEGVINAASQMPSQFAGGAIARGSLFRILGVRLGPANSALGGVSVRVRKGSAAFDAVPTYVSATRIDAILPASSPTGDVSLTVTYNGLTSAPFPVKVVESSFGIFTSNGAGWGPATDAPATPGETIMIRGTGLGTAREPEILLGGRRGRRIRYAGPSRRGAGEDEIRFQIPEDAPQGCHVPVEVRIGGVPSNVATVAVAPKGQPCAATAAWLGSDSLALLLRAKMQSARFGKWIADLVAARFEPSQSSEFELLRMLPPPGTCTAYARTIAWDDLNELVALRNLVAGDWGWLTVSGPEGSKSVTKGPRGPFTYWRALGGFSPGRGKLPEPLFLEPGDYTIEGRGDRAIGSFRAETTVPAPLEWTNRSQIDTIDRSKDVAVTWNSAAPSDFVIVIATNMDQVTGAMGLCACVAPGNAGHFTVPASTLSNLPPTTGEERVPLNLLILARIPAQGGSSGRVLAAYASLDSRTVDFR